MQHHSSHVQVCGVASASRRALSRARETGCSPRYQQRKSLITFVATPAAGRTVPIGYRAVSCAQWERAGVRTCAYWARWRRAARRRSTPGYGAVLRPPTDRGPSGRPGTTPPHPPVIATSDCSPPLVCLNYSQVIFALLMVTDGMCQTVLYAPEIQGDSVCTMKYFLVTKIVPEFSLRNQSF